MKAKKKPVVVDVMRLKMYSARSYRKCKEFVGESWVDHDNMPNGLPGIATLEGTMEISDGDYIIKGVHGEFYPCKPDIFEETYDLVNDADTEKVDYSDYGFLWNGPEKTLIVNGQKEECITKALITLVPYQVVKVELEKLVTMPNVGVIGEVDVEIKDIHLDSGTRGLAE
ncbi:hypothetical protein IGK30_003212 [Enterococcus sp. AZ178]|uniref:hypothetical protein n=1 Tax=Enterococcus sp. AZ178 TaxID=2774822 RepID=UPI003F23B182